MMKRRVTLQIKWIFDVLVAIFLILLLSPLLLLISLIIKLESPGPVIFKHKRIGENEKPFKMWKFRTMVNRADLVGPGLTKPDDRRITKFGRFLRRTSLDELPQLLNVLCGQMSLVGPRPEIPEIVDTYTLQQKRALSIKPGITGLSQINGRDDLPIHDKLNYEIDYIDKLSLALDIKILIKTIPAIIRATGNRY